MNDHPSLSELRHHFLGDSDSRTLHSHLATCVACRVRYSRIAQIEEPSSPNAQTIQRIVDASEVVPGLAALASADHGTPKAGDLWRVGRDEGLLAWVRQNLGDGAVDVVPVVLDVDFADELSVLVPATASPLFVELAMLVALRTHVHEGAFIDRIGELDAASEVGEVISALREGRPSRALVGTAIESEDDERLEYRQATRDLFAELSPSAWVSEGDDDDQGLAAAWEEQSERDEIGDVRVWFERLVGERLPSAKCFALREAEVPVDAYTRLTAFAKVAYLDTAVVVLTVDSADALNTKIGDLAHACRVAVSSSPDADAVCVAARIDEWPSVLFSRASLRDAVELPVGQMSGPVAVLSGLDVVDTLWKHLEGSALAWDITEVAPRGLTAVDVESMASRHVETAIAAIQAQARRALQPAKKTAWADLPEGLAGQVARLVASAASSVSPSDAVAEFERGNPG